MQNRNRVINRKLHEVWVSVLVSTGRDRQHPATGIQLFRNTSPTVLTYLESLSLFSRNAAVSPLNNIKSLARLLRGFLIKITEMLSGYYDIVREAMAEE